MREGRNLTQNATFTSSSTSMREALRLADAVAGRETTVLLVGQTGTGKSLFARAIHARSLRDTRPFVELNCATIHGELAESELFGHERGSFTGAAERKVGLFESAESGTILLDEIGEMELKTQAKLLYALETRTFRRVGGIANVPFNVRLMAATNRDLRIQIREGVFREDLFHRLNVFSIHLPPLCSRKEDIESLANHFLEQFTPGEITLAPSALDALQAYDWPGNIRELRNVLERAVILCSPGTAVLPCHLGLGGTEAEIQGSRAPTGMIRESERAHIENAVRCTFGNISAAAKILGISRATVYRKARRYGIFL